MSKNDIEIRDLFVSNNLISKLSYCMLKYKEYDPNLKKIYKTNGEFCNMLYLKNVFELIFYLLCNTSSNNDKLSVYI